MGPQRRAVPGGVPPAAGGVLTRRDLSDELTVFVITTGEEPLDDCLAALERQTCAFRVERVEGVHPMSAAFQAMPDRAVTPMFLQVDADMVLDEDAVERLHAALRRSAPWTYMVAGMLREDGEVRGSLKCWKRSLFRCFSFRDCRTVDRDLHRRTRRLGLRWRLLPGTFGEHRATASPYSGYLKAKADVEKWRFLGRPPERYALPLLDSLAGDGERRIGALLGALTIEPRLSRSKDAVHERTLCERLPALDPPPLSDELREAFRAAYAAPPVAGRPERARLAAALGAPELVPLLEEEGA